PRPVQQRRRGRAGDSPFSVGAVLKSTEAQSRNAPLADETGHGLGSHDPGPTDTPPALVQSVSVSSSHSPASPCWFSFPCASSSSAARPRMMPGTVGAHGPGSQATAPTFTPFSPAQSAALSSLQSSCPALGTQHTMSPDGGVVGQGFGKQDPAP